MGLLARLFQLVGAGAGVAFEQRVGKGLRQLFALREDEDALCFINIGTISEARRGKPRPDSSAYFSRLGD